MEQYAAAGEVFVCPNGHRIGKLINDLHWGELFTAEHVEWFQPFFNGDIARCRECGANWGKDRLFTFEGDDGPRTWKRMRGRNDNRPN